MQKVRLCVVCSMEIEGNKRTQGNARKTCSIACRNKRYKEKLDAWLLKNCQKMKKYHSKYSKTRVRESKSTLSPWAPMHYDVLSD